ncbi:MAG: 30S ribosomal protein S19 [Nanohaloarchaea archaeon]|nr:30S ribosomal protein S19 [Candidatus Nanohaloarchaea archaeon]
MANNIKTDKFGKRIFTFRGKTVEELRALSMDEFMGLIKSRGRRHMIHGFSDLEKKLIDDIKTNPDKFVKTHARDMIVLPDFIGKKIGIHNGKEFVSVDIKEEMVGHRFGEFAQTRRVLKHSGVGVGATKSSKFVALK